MSIDLLRLMDVVRWLARHLNEYANLLLVILTAVYVVLTWRSLQELRASQTRIARTQHLSDIKEYVVAPLQRWLQEVLDTLSGTGTRPLTLIQAISGENNLPVGIELYPQRIPIDNLSEHLLEDAAKIHFREELKQYNAVRQILESLFRDICASSKECCVELRKSATLPRLASVNRTGNFESFEELVHGCLPYLLIGIDPHDRLHYTNVEARTCVFIHTQIAAVAADSQENIDRWLPEAIQTVKDEWREKKFTSRITDVRESAQSLQKAIQSISFVQEIPGKCKYIGG